MCGCFLVATAVAEESATRSRTEPSNLHFANFGKLRDHLLNQFSGAKSRIWLVTDYLTDGEIVSALYIAQFRKINVQVLLGRAKLRAYMSRLRFLTKQKVPTFTRPRTFPFREPSVVLVDETLFKINGNINFLARERIYTLKTGSPAEANAYMAEFVKATNKGKPAVAAPVPLVGKARHDRYGKPKEKRSFRIARPVKPAYKGERDGSFNYDQAPKQRSAPRDMPRKLPKETIEQRNKRLQNSD